MPRRSRATRIRAPSASPRRCARGELGRDGRVMPHSMVTMGHIVNSMMHLADGSPQPRNGVCVRAASVLLSSRCSYGRGRPPRLTFRPTLGNQLLAPAGRSKVSGRNSGGADSATTNKTQRVSPTAPETQSASAMVWRGLESLPGFSDELRQAEADLKAGRGVRFSEVRRSR
jgi:hypothetical protein